MKTNKILLEYAKLNWDKTRNGSSAAATSKSSPRSASENVFLRYTASLSGIGLNTIRNSMLRCMYFEATGTFDMKEVFIKKYKKMRGCLISLWKMCF